MFLKKLRAISYIEVLLTLVVVGVISSLAIPSLKKYSQREELGRLAQKAYLTLNEAMDMSIMDNGATYKWDTGTSSFSKYIVPYLKVSSGSSSSVVTKDNMQITVTGANSTSDKKINLVTVKVDVNNEKGPNVDGKDRFTFNLDFANSTIIPTGDADTLFKNNWKFTDELWNK